MRKVAKAFGMSVTELAECIGYSRAALYGKTCLRNEKRVQAAIRYLKLKSSDMLAEDHATAERKFRERRDAIEEAEKALKAIMKEDN